MGLAEDRHASRHDDSRGVGADVPAAPASPDPLSRPAGKARVVAEVTLADVLDAIEVLTEGLAGDEVARIAATLDLTEILEQAALRARNDVYLREMVLDHVEDVAAAEIRRASCARRHQAQERTGRSGR